jgi:hypothetical protein
LFHPHENAWVVVIIKEAVAALFIKIEGTHAHRATQKRAPLANFENI